MSTESGEDFGGSTGPYEGATGWSGSGEMITGDTSKEASLAANFSKPSDFTVQFSLLPLGPDSPPPALPLNYWAALQATATIRWSVKGVTLTRKISVTNGASLTGVGQGVSVVVDDTTSPISVHTLLGRPYKVGITVAPGTRGSDTNPPILWPDNAVRNVGHNGTTFYPVPQGCGVKSVLVTVSSNGNGPIPEQSIEVSQLDAVGTTLAMYDPRAYEFIPVLPGCVSIRIFNYGLAFKVSTIFGIDG